MGVRTETMINLNDLFEEAMKYLLVTAVGWLVATLSFQRRLDNFEKRIVAPIRDNVSKLEGASALFVTRDELKSEIASLRTDFKEAIAEVKSLIRELRTGQ
jgi:methyl-accepting chemotaxis protein